MKENKMLNLERLEDRCTPASINVTQAGSAVFVEMRKAGFVSVQQNRVVTSDGTVPTNGTITDVVVLGSQKDDVIEINLPVNATIIGGKGDDTIFGGTGVNRIDAGDGKDLVYALLGTNTIVANDGGDDLVYTNFPAQVFSDKGDRIARFFGPGRTPGSSFVGMSTSGDDAGTLYINPPDGGSFTRVRQEGKKTVVDYNFGPGTQTKTFTGVKLIAYFGGGGDDFYLNDTDIDEAAYGAAGNDAMISGFADRVLLKGSGGNDVLIARGERNDVSTNPSSSSVDIVILLGGKKKDVVRAGPSDLVFGLDRNDVYVPQFVG